jgi:phosphomannomutase
MELEKVQRDGVPPLPPREDLIRSLDVRTPYLETVAGLVDWDRLRAAKFRFVVDPMHGAGRGLLSELFRRYGIECEEIRGTRDPLFGGVNPEPIDSLLTETPTASAQWTATGLSLRRTRFSRFCCGIWRARAS